MLEFPPNTSKTGAQLKMRTVKLHLGAHKTATTYIQHQLESNAQFFSEYEQYIPLGVTRSSIGPMLDGKDVNRRRLAKFIDGYADANVLVISDENLSGNARQLKNGTLYKTLGQRCLQLRSAFPREAHFEVVFSFRNYGDFIASMYCEYLRHNLFCTFEHYLSSSNARNISWPSVFKILEDVFGRESLYFYNFDRFSTYEVEIMKRLLPDSRNYRKFGIERNGSVMRSTFSNSAISFLVDSSKHLDSDGMRKVVVLMDQPGWRENWINSEKFRPLSDDGYFSDKYAEDLEELARLDCFV